MTVTKGLMRPREVGELIGMSERHVNRLIEQGHFPAGSVLRTGGSKTRPRKFLLTARLIEAGWLRESQLITEGESHVS